MSKLKFDCGCSFECLGDNKIVFSPKIENINLECKKTWDLISDGNTKGVFQLESRLGQSIAKKLKPENMEQLSALISILRPGSLEAMREGKSVTNHYIDRKNYQESIDYFHPALEPILGSTLGELIYQEQAIQIAKDIAGFTLSESDTLRKSIGKKDVKLMAEIKGKFLDGCKKQNIVSEQDAQEIFGWIEKSQRYSFNKSILDDTIVISESGPKAIKDLNIGEKILAPTKYGDKYIEVINKYDHGEQPIFELTLEDNYQISCTMEHKFLCDDEIIRPLSEILLYHHKILCRRNVSRSWVNIERLGILSTVDIEVKSDNHLFYGNGIVTSNSHAVSYAMNAYLSAYTKAHFPQAFFCSYLRFAKDKVDPQQEIKQLVKNANEMDIIICLPDLRLMNRLFEIKENKIYFGLTDIKGLGLSVYNKLLDINTKHSIRSMNYLQTLFYVLHKINSSSSKALISSGALDYFNKNRTEILFDFELSSSLTDKEINYLSSIISNNESSLKDCFNYLIYYAKVNKNRKTIISGLLQTYIEPPYSLVDKIEWLADNESAYLGTAISCSKLDSYNISMTNSTCKEFKNSDNISNTKIILAGEITFVNTIKTKTGKNPGQEMAFLTIEDQTGSLDSIILFPETYQKYKHHLFEENILVFSGNRAKSKDGLIVEKCFVPAS